MGCLVSLDMENMKDFIPAPEEPAFQGKEGKMNIKT